jgi:mannose-6-phosphate isomerase-like protein (cupin superfamily)
MELSERCIKTLEKEGFPYIYEWSDSPNTVYETHSHQDKVTLFVTEGTITFTFAGETKQLRAGDRINVPPRIPHSALVGPAGCQLVVGEMIDGDS